MSALPCPFCGSTDTWTTNELRGNPKEPVIFFREQCRSCGACGPQAERDVDKAYRQWNRRVFMDVTINVQALPGEVKP